MSSNYSPYFEYTYKPATAEDPVPQCIKVPEDYSKCRVVEQKTPNPRVFDKPGDMNLYHNNENMFYRDGIQKKGFPKKMDYMNDSSFSPVSFNIDETPLHIIDSGNLQCTKPQFPENESIFNNNTPCYATE